MPDQSLSLVIPVSDDTANLSNLVLECLAVVPRHFPDFELIIVVDGSDPTKTALVDRLAAAHDPVMVIHLPRKRGYGFALATGWQAARGDHILLMDASGEVRMTDLARLEPFIGKYDVVISYFTRRQHALIDRFVDTALTRLVNLLFGLDLYDISCRYAVFRAELLQHLPTVSTSSLVFPELYRRAAEAGASRVQVGVSHTFRSADAGSVILSSPMDIIRLRLGLRRGRPISEPLTDWRPLWRRRAMQGLGLATVGGAAWMVIRRLFVRR